MRVLVTGSNGFIAKQLMIQLQFRKEFKAIIGANRQSKVTPFRASEVKEYETEDVFCDFDCSSSVAFLMQQAKPDVVFHLAGNSSPQIDNWNPFLHHRNISQTHHILHSCMPVTKFVLASSILVYGQNENPRMETDSASPKTVYAVTKAAAEMMCCQFHSQYKVEAKLMRLANVVGPTMTRGVVHDIWQRIKTESGPLMLRNAQTRRPFIHVLDVCRAMIASVLDISKVSPFYLNVSPTDAITVKRVAEIVMEETGMNREIVCTEPHGQEDNVEVYSNSGFYGVAPKYNSETAIRQVIRVLENKCVI